MQKSLHVYVCSTYRDLVSERNAIVDGLENLTSQFQGITYSCSRSIQPLDQCKDEIGRSDILILIMGHMQGVIAPGLDVSYGEAEYQEGISQGKQILVYFRDEKTGIYPVHFERDASRAGQLKTFKQSLESKHGAKIFFDIPSLVTLVTDDLSKLAGELGFASKTGSRNTRAKAKTWVTRKIPTTASTVTIPSVPPSEDHLTRTIPTLQKALATPFYRRKTGLGRATKGILLALGLAIIAGLFLTEFSKLGLIKSLHAQPSGPERGTETTSVIPAGSIEPQTDSLATPPPVSSEVMVPAAPKASATVVMMDDTDPTKAFVRKAMEGSREEQFQLAQMYEAGKDLPRNDSLALLWYKKAAEKGMVEAQYKLGLMYRVGQGTKRSSYQSAHWFEAAAESGYSKAQVKLGQMYRSGKGVLRNETTAFKWFLKAADQKDPDAEKILAELKEN